MKRTTFSAILIIAAVVAVFLGGRAISAQDKYTVQVPGGLAFADFRGYEGWQVIAISENGGKIAVIMGNPAMIDAFKEGVPTTASLSRTAPGWRKSTGSRKSKSPTPVSQWCRGPSMTSISW
ncbi:hypothetical protein [Bradyrhizobium sp.]|uniref:hypothetical protein n=1 Tax=Bradyrhizobium sp. TaxID=376 RepID=UPI0025C34413|nr:hypothetical protein [Bradyrhizobium sp.]